MTITRIDSHYSIARSSFLYIGPKLWRTIGPDLQSVSSISVFARRYKQRIITRIKLLWKVRLIGRLGIRF